jgi:hypothetical protein
MWTILHGPAKREPPVTYNHKAMNDPLYQIRLIRSLLVVTPESACAYPGSLNCIKIPDNAFGISGMTANGSSGFSITPSN